MVREIVVVQDNHLEEHLFKVVMLTPIKVQVEVVQVLILVMEMNQVVMEDQVEVEEKDQVQQVEQVTHHQQVPHKEVMVVLEELQDNQNNLHQVVVVVLVMQVWLELVVQDQQLNNLL